MPVRATKTERAKSFLAWAFLISLAAHVTFGGLVRYQPYRESDTGVEQISVTRQVHIVVPTPRPTPPPEPTTTPEKPHANRPQQRLIVKPPITARDNHGDSHGERPYHPPTHGSSNGVPDSTAAPSTAAPATPEPTIAATPIATPRPACAVPNKDATTTRAVQPDYPEIAQQQGAAGTTEVKVLLAASGAVLDASIHQSSGNAALDKAALSAARASSYSPEIQDCRAVSGYYLFRADFTSQ